MKTNYKSLLIVLILLITTNGCEEDGVYLDCEKQGGGIIDIII